MNKRAGFTLIELSIVLVIIGLIVGGVLVGRDLIDAAQVRAQMTQIEQYQTAVRTFQSKYNCLPGDCAKAATFGFPARGPYRGQGDDNGLIEGNGSDTADAWVGGAGGIGDGEPVLFWEDLSQAHLIAGLFNSATYNFDSVATGSENDAFFPKAKIGNNWVYVWSGGMGQVSDRGSSESGLGSGGTDGLGGNPVDLGNNINYFAISTASPTYPTFKDNFGWLRTYVGLTVAQAFSIDTKLDDGFPQTGRVTSMVAGTPCAGGGVAYEYGYCDMSNSGQPVDTRAVQGDSTTCFDNNNTDGVPQHYSTEMNGGNGMNCGLSFQFQ